MIQERRQPGADGRRLVDDVHRDCAGSAASRRRASSCSWTAPRSGSARCSCTCKAEVNWHRLFHELIDDFDERCSRERQRAALARAGVPLPAE